MKQFTIQVPNGPGAIAKVTETLAKGAVNIKAISSEIRAQYGLIRVVTSDEASTRNMLQKARFRFDESEILVLSLIDRPGELSKYARKIADAGINVESIYILDSANGKTNIAIKVDNLKKARQVAG